MRSVSRSCGRGYFFTEGRSYVVNQRSPGLRLHKGRRAVTLIYLHSNGLMCHDMCVSEEGRKMPNIHESTSAYEAWLRTQLGGEIVDKDLDRKHEKMRATPFAFLRATYWRWAETVLEICGDLGGASKVLAVGDIHLENFGTWRDVDGRLVWGVNDFDEAAVMPFALDLARLA